MARESTGRHAFLVAAGILISRIMGLVRQRVFSGYFGLLDEADAFTAALRVPNFLQNLFGEGVLSASFIPVYARLLAQGDDEEADRVAGAVGAILAISSSTIVLLGVVVTPYIMWAIAPGYVGPKRELTTLLVRILFPGAGLLVCSAWCLGILNSHRKFFLSYTAPVVWNLAMIGTILAFRHSNLHDLAVKLAWGTVLGCALQFAVQVPMVLELTGKLRLRPEMHSAHVREVVKNFVPVAISRGVVNISAFVDQALASLVGKGAMAAMTTAQSIYMLPVSLFGMAVSAAELPAMSSALGTEEEIALRLRGRLNGGLRQIAFFIVPSAMAFFALGDVVTAALYETREVHAQGFRVRLGNHCGFRHWVVGVDSRPPVRFDVLCAARYADAAALRFGARRTHHQLGVPVRLAASEVARHRSALGGRGADCVGRRGGMGGVHAAAAHAERAHWSDRRGGAANRETLGIGGGGRGGGVGDQAHRREGESSDHGRDSCAGAIRLDLLRRDLFVAGGGVWRAV